MSCLRTPFFISLFSLLVCLCSLARAESPLYRSHGAPTPALSPHADDRCKPDAVRRAFLSEPFELHTTTKRLPAAHFEAIALSSLDFRHRFLNFETEKYIANPGERYQSGCVIEKDVPSLGLVSAGSSENYSYLHFYSGGMQANEGLLLTCSNESNLIKVYVCSPAYHGLKLQTDSLASLRKSFAEVCTSLSEVEAPPSGWEQLRACRDEREEYCLRESLKNGNYTERKFQACLGSRYWIKEVKNPESACYQQSMALY